MKKNILFSVICGLIIISIPLLFIVAEDNYMSSPAHVYLISTTVLDRQEALSILVTIFGGLTLIGCAINLFLEKKYLTFVNMVLSLFFAGTALATGIECLWTEALKVHSILLMVTSSLTILIDILFVAFIIISLVKKIQLVDGSSSVTPKVVKEKANTKEADSLKIALRLYKEGAITEDEFIALSKKK